MVNDNAIVPTPNDSASSGANKAAVLPGGEKRIHYHCHTEVLVDGHRIFHGFIKDITISGAKLYLEHNLEHEKILNLRVQLPPLDSFSRPRVFDVTAKNLATVYDSAEECFRSIITFIQFAQDSDRDYLQARINFS